MIIDSLLCDMMKDIEIKWGVEWMFEKFEGLNIIVDFEKEEHIFRGKMFCWQLYSLKVSHNIYTLY